MTSSDRELAARYPVLFAPQRWEWGGLDAAFATTRPPTELVTNVHVVGFVGEQIVVCSDQREVWFLPGGTREPGESIQDCAGRELREEAGACLVGPLHWIGAHYCVSDRAEPYRPHQPHPERAWLWCLAEVIVDSAPTIPAGGEQVVEVRVVDAVEACRLLLTDGEWLPEIVSLALEVRSTALLGKSRRKRG